MLLMFCSSSIFMFMFISKFCVKNIFHTFQGKAVDLVQTTVNSIKTVYRDAGATEFSSIAVTLLNVVSNLFKAQYDQNEMLLEYGKCHFFEYSVSDISNTRSSFLNFLMFCAILYIMQNLKIVKNTDGGMLIFSKVAGFSLQHLLEVALLHGVFLVF